MQYHNLLIVCLCLGAMLFPTLEARAQTPPGTVEVAAYEGLHAAAARGDVAELRRMIQGKPDLATRDSHGRTALHVAAHGSYLEIVRVLAEAGADMRAKDSRNYDIITIAAVRDDVAMVDLALQLGADPRAITSPYEGTALIAAAHLGHDGVVRSLIRAGAPLDHVNNLGWTAAIEAVILGDGGPRHQATLKALVDAGANIRIADRDGATPIDHAKRRGFEVMVDMLSATR